MGVCEAKPHLTTHSSPGVCRVSCLVLRVELPSERRCLDDLVELSSAGIFDISAPFPLAALGQALEKEVSGLSPT